ncbi:hypothetical protein ACKFKG_16390 [Phormidesmis sp. 146-35]
MSYSPIALFIYKRPDHTRQTLISLMQCPEFAESPLFVFCDGAKKPEDADKIQETRSLVRELVGETAKIIEAPQNQGLANSIISGIDLVFRTYDRCIIIEDDLVVHPRCLGFLNAALDQYEAEPSVMQVSAHMYPVPEFTQRTEALFLPIHTSWGWATWKRAWAHFDPQAVGWEALEHDRDLRTRFNFDGTFDYFNTLKMQMSGTLDSWAIRWYWSIFKQRGCTLFPPISYINNIGFDGTGTHGWRSARRFFNQANPPQPPIAFQLPEEVRLLDTELATVKKTLRKLRPRGLVIVKGLLFLRKMKRALIPARA